MKSRKWIAAAVAALCISVLPFEPSVAQLVKAYSVVGLNISQIDGDEVFGFNKFAPDLGVGVMVPLSPKTPYKGWQLSLEILFSQRGARETQDPFAYKSTLSYIDIPLMVHYIDIIGGWTFGVGVQYGRLVKSKEDWGLPDTVISGFERPFDFPLPPAFEKYDLCIVGEIRFKIWERLKFSFRYQHSILPIRKDVWYYNGKPAGTGAPNGYESWSRDFKNNYMSLRLIYMINERSSRELDRNINKTRY